MKVTIPKTVAGAKKFATSQAAQVNEAEWALAALVYAWVEPADPLDNLKPLADRRPSSVVGKVSITEFAQWGAKGARSREQVNRYRAAWQTAIDDGQAKPVEPGEQVELPETRDFPEHPHSASGTVRSFKAAVKRDPTVIKQVVANDPDALEAVAEAVSQSPGLTLRASEKVAARVTPKPKPAQPKHWDQVTDEVIADFERAFIHLHALVENRDQLDEYELKKVITSLSANAMNLNQYLTDLKDTYRATWGEPRITTKELA